MSQVHFRTCEQFCLQLDMKLELLNCRVRSPEHENYIVLVISPRVLYSTRVVVLQLFDFTILLLHTYLSQKKHQLEIPPVLELPRLAYSCAAFKFFPHACREWRSETFAPSHPCLIPFTFVTYYPNDHISQQHLV